MRVGVYGLGRFGYFWADLLSERFKVKAYGRNPERLCPPRVLRVPEEEVLDCDALFLCCAISSLREVLSRIAPGLKKGILVADTCSVKIYPAGLMREILPESVYLLSTHPMFGPDSARRGLSGLPLVYHPLRMPEDKDAFWKAYFRGLGLKVVELSPEEHDRMAADTQGVTHFIGRVLEDMGLKPSEIGTVGYGDLLAIIEQTCNDPWQLFLDLQQYNPYTGQMRTRLKSSLEKIMGIIVQHGGAGPEGGRI